VCTQERRSKITLKLPGDFLISGRYLGDDENAAQPLKAALSLSFSRALFNNAAARSLTHPFTSLFFFGACFVVFLHCASHCSARAVDLFSAPAISG
jgi:hypothetical protein